MIVFTGQSKTALRLFLWVIVINTVVMAARLVVIEGRGNWLPLLVAQGLLALYFLFGGKTVPADESAPAVPEQDNERISQWNAPEMNPAVFDNAMADWFNTYFERAMKAVQIADPCYMLTANGNYLFREGDWLVKDGGFYYHFTRERFATTFVNVSDRGDVIYRPLPSIGAGR